MAIKYPATLIRALGGGYSATFPDLPEAEPAIGADIEDALREGRRAFMKALPLYIQDNECLPRPSATHPRYSITLTMEDIMSMLPNELKMMVDNQPEPTAFPRKYLPGVRA